MNIIAIILEKFLTLSFVLILQVLVSWKFGTISYASLILIITLFSSLNIMNVNTDLSFAKRSKHNNETLEIYDIFAINRAFLLTFSACFVYVFLDGSTNPLWILLVLFQYICDSTASNRVIYNNLDSKIHKNIFAAFFRLIALSGCYFLNVSEFQFILCVCLINITWVVCILKMSAFKTIRLKSYLNLKKHKKVFAAFKEDIGYFHLVGYMTLLIGRFDILVYGYLSVPSEAFALIAAISMATNTLGLVFASIMPLNLKTAKLDVNNTFNQKNYSQYLFFSSISLGILSVLLIVTHEIWLGIILPSLEVVAYDYFWILVFSLLNIFIVRVFIQVRMSFLIIKKSARSILLKVVLPPLMVGGLCLLIATQFISELDLRLYLILVMIKIIINLCWLYTSYKTTKGIT